MIGCPAVKITFKHSLLYTGYLLFTVLQHDSNSISSTQLIFLTPKEERIVGFRHENYYNMTQMSHCVYILYIISNRLALLALIVLYVL